MKRPLLLLLALAVVGLAALGVRRWSQRDAAAAPPAPRGWWNLAPDDAQPRSREALARELSLPYLAGVERAGAGRYGVRIWERAAAQPGWNLYVSGHAPEAILTAMDGTVLHRWGIPFARAFPGEKPTVDSGSFRRVKLLANGNLLAIFQGTGLVELDPESRLLWRYDVPVFNDLWVEPDERRILLLAKLATRRPDLRTDGPLLEDFVVTLDGGGHELARASLLAAFERSSYRQLMLPLGATADAFHSNAISVLGPGGSGAFAPGNLLVSFREIDTVATLAPDASRLLWAARGPFRGQHSPLLLADGRLLLFDNRGGEKGATRVATLDPKSGLTETYWSGPPGHRLRSAQAGACHLLSNGDLLVVESEHGTAYELEPQSRRVVWEFANPHRAGARAELVAMLFDLERLERPTPFLRSLAAGAAQSP